MKKLDHLSEIYSSYDTFVIDLWGVMHNGILLHEKALEVADNLLKDSKKIIFLSNAPRPSEKVKEFLKKMKMEERFLKNVITSGEAAMSAINANRYGKLFYHLGPSRDQSIFQKIKENKTKLEESDFILCTGLFDEEYENLQFYKDLLKNNTNKKLVCTNPDLIVHKGGVEEYCAGKIAEIFENLGGKVIYFGKPHKEVYLSCLKTNQKTLVIGDNLRTDIKGANNMNLDSLFITSGVHKSKTINENLMVKLLVEHKVSANYFQKELTW